MTMIIWYGRKGNGSRWFNKEPPLLSRYFHTFERMEKMVQIPDDFINENTEFRELIAALKKGFGSDEILVPMRHHHDFPDPQAGADSTQLLIKLTLSKI